MTPDDLRNIRRSLGETQASLAQRLGVSHYTVESWEGGRRKIPELAVRLLATLTREHTDAT